MYGVQIDNNPKILKILSKCRNVSIWGIYLKFRRFLGKKNEKINYL